MNLTRFEDIKDGMPVFMPSGIQARLFLEGENIAVEYPELYRDKYTKEDFQKLMDEGIMIFHDVTVPQQSVLMEDTILDKLSKKGYIRESLKETLEDGYTYQVCIYDGDDENAEPECIAIEDTEEAAIQRAKYEYEHSDLDENTVVCVMWVENGEQIWYIDKDCEEKLNEAFNQEDNKPGDVYTALNDKKKEYVTPDFKNELLTCLTKICKEYPVVKVRQQAATFMDELGLQEYYDVKAVKDFINKYTDLLSAHVNESLNEEDFRAEANAFLWDACADFAYQKIEELAKSYPTVDEILQDDEDLSIEGEAKEYAQEILDMCNKGYNESLNEEDDKFNYMMLDRLRQDCEYYLGNGNRNEKQLWAGNVKDQIAEMRKIYDKLPEKPEWISLEDIDNYERQMLSTDESLNEEQGPYYGSEALGNIAIEIENGNKQGVEPTEFGNWVLHTSIDEKWEQLTEDAKLFILEKIAMPVADGHVSYDDLELYISDASSLTREDITSMGIFDEEQIDSMLNGNEEMFLVSYELQFDGDIHVGESFKQKDKKKKKQKIEDSMNEETINELSDKTISNSLKKLAKRAQEKEENGDMEGASEDTEQFNRIQNKWAKLKDMGLAKGKVESVNEDNGAGVYVKDNEGNISGPYINNEAAEDYIKQMVEQGKKEEDFEITTDNGEEEMKETMLVQEAYKVYNTVGAEVVDQGTFNSWTEVEDHLNKEWGNYTNMMCKENPSFGSEEDKEAFMGNYEIAPIEVEVLPDVDLDNMEDVEIEFMEPENVECEDGECEECEPCEDECEEECSDVCPECGKEPCECETEEPEVEDIEEKEDELTEDVDLDELGGEALTAEDVEEQNAEIEDAEDEEDEETEEEITTPEEAVEKIDDVEDIIDDIEEYIKTLLDAEGEEMEEPEEAPEEEIQEMCMEGPREPKNKKDKKEDEEKNEEFTDNMGMLTDINDLDFPDALANTIETKEDGSLYRIGDLAKELEELKSMFTKEIENIKNDIKSALQDVKQDVKQEINNVGTKVQDTKTAVDDLTVEDDMETEEPVEEAPAEEEDLDNEPIEEEPIEDEETEEGSEEELEESVNPIAEAIEKTLKNKKMSKTTFYNKLLENYGLDCLKEENQVLKKMIDGYVKANKLTKNIIDESVEAEEKESTRFAMNKYLRKGMMEDIDAAKKKVDELTSQNKSADEIKNAITLLSDNEDEEDEASEYAVEKMKESLLQTSQTSKLGFNLSNNSTGLGYKR